MGFLTSHQLGAGRKNILYGQWLDGPPLGGSYFFFTQVHFPWKIYVRLTMRSPILYSMQVSVIILNAPAQGLGILRVFA